VARFEVAGQVCYVQTHWEATASSYEVRVVVPRPGHPSDPVRCWATSTGLERRDEVAQRVNALGWFEGPVEGYVALARRALERQDGDGAQFHYAVRRGPGREEGWPAAGETLVLEWHKMARAVPLVSAELLEPVADVGGALDAVLGQTVAHAEATQRGLAGQRAVLMTLEKRVKYLTDLARDGAKRRREADAKMLDVLAEVFNRRGRIVGRGGREDTSPAACGSGGDDHGAGPSTPSKRRASVAFGDGEGEAEGGETKGEAKGGEGEAKEGEGEGGVEGEGEGGVEGEGDAEIKSEREEHDWEESDEEEFGTSESDV